MRKATIFLVLAFLLVLCATPAYAIPVLPHAFYGSVDINGAAAIDGARVSATVANGTVLPTQNPVRTVGGNYGVDSLKLLVQGNGLSGAITFYVNGHEATPSRAVTFEAGGGPTQIGLSVTIEEEEEVVGVAPPAAMYVETNLFGIKKRYLISEEGAIPKIEATSADGMLTFTIDKDTIALDKDGNPLSTLTVAVDPSPLCPPPENACIIGLAYAFEPAGGTFDPPITFTWSYDPADLPEDVAEGDLIMAYCDEDAGEWVEIPSTVDLVTHTITGSVSHFTTFAIIAPSPAPPVVAPPPAPATFSLSTLTVKPAEVQPKEAVTITVSVANTGGMEGSYTVVLKIKGVKEAEKSITIAAGASEIVTFSVTKEATGSYSVTVDGLSASFTVVAPPAPPLVPEKVEVPAPPPINWPLIGLIIAAVVVVALLIFYLVVRRRAA